MTPTSTQPGFGPLLRDWRRRRRITQLDLALEAGISAKHLSFVETGRSNPNPEIVLLLAKQLGVPFRERNPRDMLGPIRLRGAEEEELSFFGMFATFDTPFDVTTSELAIEFVFPADPPTAAALEDLHRK